MNNNHEWSLSIVVEEVQGHLGDLQLHFLKLLKKILAFPNQYLNFSEVELFVSVKFPNPWDAKCHPGHAHFGGSHFQSLLSLLHFLLQNLWSPHSSPHPGFPLCRVTVAYFLANTMEICTKAWHCRDTYSYANKILHVLILYFQGGVVVVLGFIVFVCLLWTKPGCAQVLVLTLCSDIAPSRNLGATFNNKIWICISHMQSKCLTVFTITLNQILHIWESNFKGGLKCRNVKLCVYFGMSGDSVIICWLQFFL